MKPSVKHRRFLAARQTILINKNCWKEQIKSTIPLHIFIYTDGREGVEGGGMGTHANEKLYSFFVLSVNEICCYRFSLSSFL
jgi:hypothetical protein